MTDEKSPVADNAFCKIKKMRGTVMHSTVKTRANQEENQIDLILVANKKENIVKVRCLTTWFGF